MSSKKYIDIIHYTILAVRWKLTNPNARFCPQGGITPGTSIDWEISSEERDPGLPFSSSSKGASSVPWLPRGQSPSCHKHSMTSQEKEVIILLCSALAQPQLELCVQCWDPPVRKDVRVLECIQERATKLVEGLEGMSCDEWLRSLGLSGLEKWLRDNLIAP